MLEKNKYFYKVNALNILIFFSLFSIVQSVKMSCKISTRYFKISLHKIYHKIINYIRL